MGLGIFRFLISDFYNLALCHLEITKSKVANQKLVLSEVLVMHSRFSAHLLICAALILALASVALAQGGGTQSELSPLQRLDVMRSKLDSMRRSLNGAISSIEQKQANQGEKKNPDDPRERLRGLDKEVGSIVSELSDVRGKQERSERYDPTILDRLETSVADLNTRVQAGLQATASARTGGMASGATPTTKKKKGRLFGLLGGGGVVKNEALTADISTLPDSTLFRDGSRSACQASTRA